MHLNHILFLVMSAIWGVTWISTKAGLNAVPPLFFGAVRYVLVSLVLVLVVGNLRRTFGSGRAGRVVLSSLLVIVATYGFLYWGMVYVPSGVAGVVNMSMNPVFFFALAILFGQEQATWRHAGALVLGIAGLVILFSSKASFGGTEKELWGAASVVAASLAYCLGSVLTRPLLKDVSTLDVTTAQSVVGMAGMIALSLAFEPVSLDTFKALLAPGPLAGLLFVVIGGTFIAYTIFLRLMREWGASKAGLYSFVSPVVALILGAWIYAEPLGWREAAGAALMLVAAAIAIAPRAEPPPA